MRVRLMHIVCAENANRHNAGIGMLQIVVCHDRLGSQWEVDTAMSHELVHAYDQCRATNLDWTNCAHHACSEVNKSLTLLQLQLLALL